jgi:hypothetical protein
MPALGWRHFRLAEAVPETIKPKEGVIENEYFIIEVNKQTGAVVSLIHKSSGRDLIQNNLGANIFEYEDRELVSSRLTTPQVITEAGAARQSIMVTGRIGSHAYRTNITLFAGMDRVDFDSEVDCGEGATFGQKGQPETILKVRFPLSFSGQRIVHQPFGVYTSDRNIQAVLDFSAIRENDGLTVMVSSLGIPGHFMSESEIALLIGDGFPPVYGVQKYSYRLFCFSGQDATPVRMARRAREWMTPPWCMPASPLNGTKLGKSWLALNEPFVPTALLIEDDRLTLRLYNCSDYAASLDCDDHFGLGKPEVSSLGGDPIPDGNLGPWKIAKLQWRISA